MLTFGGFGGAYRDSLLFCFPAFLKSETEILKVKIFLKGRIQSRHGL